MWTELSIHFDVLESSEYTVVFLTKLYNDEQLKCNSWHADHVKLHDDLHPFLKSLTNNIIIEQDNFYYFIVILGRQCETA